MNQPSKCFRVSSLVRGLTILIVIAAIFLMAYYKGQGTDDARTLTFTTLVIINLALIFSGLTTGKTLGKFKYFFTKQTLWVSAISLVLLVGSLYIPWARETFRFSILHWSDILICLLASLCCFGLFEIRNVMANRFNA